MIYVGWCMPMYMSLRASMFTSVRTFFSKNKSLVIVTGVVTVLLRFFVLVGYLTSDWMLNLLMRAENVIEGTGDASFYHKRLITTLVATGVIGTLFIGIFLMLVLALHKKILIICRFHDGSCFSEF